MKYVKMLGLLAVAAAALMAFAASAGATIVTSPTGTPYTGHITAVNEASGEGNNHVTLTGPLGIKVQCDSHVFGESLTHGSSVTAKGSITTLEFPNCTNGYEVTVLNKGELEIHSNGTLTGNGSRVTVKTPLGFSCIYETKNTDLGTLTDSHDTGGHATLDINAVEIPRTEHSGLCGTSGKWSGRYTITTPNRLYLD